MTTVTNNSLDKVIRRNDAARAARDAGDDAAVLAALNAPTIQQTDNTPRTANWIMVEFDAVVDVATGATEADVILGTLQAATHIPRVVAAVSALSANGIDLSNPQVQIMLPALVAGADAAGDPWPPGLVDRVLAHGVWHITPAEDKFGPGTVVTTEQVAAWRAWYDLERRVKENYANTLEQISAGTVTNWTEAAAALTV